jgi:hypothetical protein
MTGYSVLDSILDDLRRDLRYALQTLRRSPGFAATAILTLALGIGANTAIFSLIDAVMLAMLPVSHPEQLMLLKWSARPRRFPWAVLRSRSVPR